MPFEEKMSWASVVVTVVVAGGYLVTMAGRLASTPVAEIAYQPAMILAVVVTVVLMIVSAIAVSAGTAIKAEVTGVGAAAEVGRKDERDISVRRRGDVVAYYISAVGLVCVLGLTMVEVDYFWIANGLYVTLLVATVVGEIVKITAYRRGF